MLASSPAFAQEPSADQPTPEQSSQGPARSGISAAGLIGNGFEDGIQFGVGARLGYNLNRVYLGGTFVYHFGETSETRENPWVGSQEASLNIYYFGAELGYDLALGPAILRPYGGFGSGTARGCIGDQCDTESRAYIAPGVALLYPITPAIFIGGDGRYVIPIDDDSDHFDHLALFASVGGYL